MKRALALSLLIVAGPAAGQIRAGDIPDGQTDDTRTADGQILGGQSDDDRPATPPPTSRASPRQVMSGRQTARSAYGYRLTAPDEDDDPADRRVLKRLNTRLNNRLETRIERYKFVDTRSERTGTTTRNPYEPRPATDADITAPVLRPRPQDDPR